MNIHEEGAERIKEAYSALADAENRVTTYSAMLLKWHLSQDTDIERCMDEMLRLNVECVQLAMNAAYRLHEVMDERIDSLAQKRMRPLDSGG